MPRPPSALAGQPPLTPDDEVIVRGFFLFFGIKDGEVAKGFDVKLKPPPPGVPHESKTSTIIAVCSVGIALMVLFTSTRLGIRMTNKSLRMGSDDYSIIVATLLALLTPILMLYRVTNAGVGRHIYDVTYWELANQRAVAPATLMISYVALAAIKISIILFYMRLTAFTSKGWMLAHRLFIALLCICAIVTVFVIAFQCKPPIRANIRELARRNVEIHCFPILNLIIGFNVWNVISDIALLVVPFKLLWNVQLKWTTKFRVCIAGVVGMANVGLSIGRAVQQSTSKGEGRDMTWPAELFYFWCAEVTLGVFTANLPVLSVIATRAVRIAGSWTGLSAPSPSKNTRSPSGGISIPPNNNLYVHQGVSRLESDIELGSNVWTGQTRGKQEVEYKSENVIKPGGDFKWPWAMAHQNG